MAQTTNARVEVVEKLLRAIEEWEKKHQEDLSWLKAEKNKVGWWDQQLQRVIADLKKDVNMVEITKIEAREKQNEAERVAQEVEEKAMMHMCLWKYPGWVIVG